MSGDETVLAATGNCYKPRCSTFLEVSGGDGNLSDDEVHLLLRSDDGEFAQGWFEAAALVEAVERARAWAIEQGRPSDWNYYDPTLALMGSQLEKLAAERDRMTLAAARATAEASRLAAAVERVRAEAEAYADQPDVLEPCGAVAQGILAALDGDDQSGDPS